MKKKDLINKIKNRFHQNQVIYFLKHLLQRRYFIIFIKYNIH